MKTNTTIAAKHADGTELFDAKTRKAALAKFRRWVRRFAEEYPEMAEENWARLEPFAGYIQFTHNGG